MFTYCSYTGSPFLFHFEMERGHILDIRCVDHMDQDISNQIIDCFYLFCIIDL